MLHSFLQITIDNQATDLHLNAGLPPTLRIDGDLVRMDTPPLSADELAAMLRGIVSADRLQELEQRGAVDFSYSYAKCRFRISTYKRQGMINMALRLLPEYLLSIEDFNIPGQIRATLNNNFGLFLVCGPTGSGKTTTLAALIDYLNHTGSHHIITIEDPIEIIHRSKRSIINQRELHSDVPSFAEGLRQGLRQDPDVIMVGEMRDAETTKVALAAAETGHLVLSTTHANTAAGSVNRLISQFPPSEQDNIRSRIADLMLGVICQRLVKGQGVKSGRVALMEICYSTPAIRSLIRQGKEDMIHDEIIKGRLLGMQTIDDQIDHLLEKGLISAEVAAENRIRK